MDSRSLDEVAVIRDSARISVCGTQRIMRKGPYRLYVEAGWVPFDDYTFDGDVLILGDVCDVVSPTGCLSVQRSQGRCAVTDTHHVIEAIDPADSDYLYRVLRCAPAEGNAAIASQTARLSEKNLRAIRIPWPSHHVRRDFCAFLDQCDAQKDALCARNAACQQETEIACSQALAGTTPCSFRLSDGFAMTAGSFLPASERKAKAPYPVVSAQGTVGFVECPTITQACIIVGGAKGGLSVQYAPEGAWPLADTVALTVKACEIETDAGTLSLELLYFLLSNDEGRMLSRAWDTCGSVDALLEFFSSVEIGCPQKTEQAQLETQVRRCLSDMAGYKTRMSDLTARSRSVMQDMLNMHDNAATAVEGAAAGVPVASDLPLHSMPAPIVLRPVRQALAHIVQDTYHRMMPRPDQSQPVSSLFGSASEQSPADALFDAAWEVIPLVYLRARRCDADWQSMSSAADCRPIIDAWLLEEAARSVSLSYVKGFLCDRSALDEQARQAIVQSLQDVKPADIEGSDMLWLHTAYLPSTPGSSSAGGCPPSVARLVCGCIDVFQPRVDSIFDPYCGPSGLLSALHAAHPYAHASGQAPDFASALIATLAASADGWMIPDGCMAAGSSLLDDAYAGCEADLVVSMLPPNAGEWTDARPDPDDARWVFGEPPRNKANLAWLQHAYFHRHRGGTAVLVLCNAVLHESRGCEPRVRRSLIASGCVRAVVALPGRILDDRRNPSCIMVLGDTRPDACETLFIDASDKGIDVEDGSRMLPLDIVQNIVQALHDWQVAGSCGACNGFCAAASKDAMLDSGDLTPWTYTH